MENKNYLIQLRQLPIWRKTFIFSLHTNTRWGKKLNLFKSNLEKLKETIIKSVLFIYYISREAISEVQK